MKKLTIAIDGHASTGKSSIAKEIAIKYGYIYINSGSMYRAVTLFAIDPNWFGGKILPLSSRTSISKPGIGTDGEPT